MKDKPDNIIYTLTIKMNRESAIGKADRGTSQVYQPSLFTDVLIMSVCALR